MTIFPALTPRNYLVAPALAALLIGCFPALAHEGHAKIAEETFAAENLTPAAATLIDQDGQSRDFRSDIIGDGPVMVTFVYTSCTTVCPVANAIFQSVETELQSRHDDRTRLISVSVDPRRDTPERFAALAKEMGAGPHWDFVTGEVAEVEAALRSLGVKTGRVEDHDPMFLVRAAGEPGFIRVLGLPEPERLLSLLDPAKAMP